MWGWSERNVREIGADAFIKLSNETKFDDIGQFDNFIPIIRVV